MSREFGELVDLAVGARRDGRLADSLELFAEAVEACRQQNNPLRLAHTVRHLADVYVESGRPDLAERHYEEALAIYRASPDTEPLDLANTLRPFAIVQEHFGRTDQARGLWTEARRLYAEADVTAGVDESTKRLANLDG